jgi:hypothetical protein
VPHTHALQWHSSKPIPVVSGENIGGMDAAVAPTGKPSRRFAEEAIRVTRPRCHLISQPCHLTH